MSMMSLNEVVAMLHQAQLHGDGQVVFERVHTDTRSLQQGDLFVALRGERFDAHSFLPLLKAMGCAAVIAERELDKAQLAGIQVADSRVALGELAQGWRKRFNIPLVAVTGSNGKTTVTQLIASIFAQWQGEAHRLATQGNFNNDVGLPLTLLRLRQAHRAAVVEIGMNHIGEVAQLASIAMPTVALINNAQREHQEFMGTVEATARENGQVLQALSEDGIAVFPGDGDQAAYAAIWRELAGKHGCLSFGTTPAQQIQWQGVLEGTTQRVNLYTPWGNCEVRLPLLGAHNAHNAAAAASAALAAGAPMSAVVAGLEQFVPVKGRLVRSDYALKDAPITLVDDTYNANPDSVIAAIQVLAQLPSPRWLILGDMGEVGEKGPEFHQEVGAYARERGIDCLFALGDLARHAGDAFMHHAHSHGKVHGAWFAQRDALRRGVDEGLAHELPRSILIKGSRFMQMEEFVAYTITALEVMGAKPC